MTKIKDSITNANELNATKPNKNTYHKADKNNYNKLALLLLSSSDLRTFNTKNMITYLTNVGILHPKVRYRFTYRADKISILKPDNCVIEYSYKELFVLTSIVKSIDDCLKHWDDIIESSCEENNTSSINLVNSEIYEKLISK